ncbi:MAG TPA: lysophospholipid acyltransferase family protein [Polyangiaceae bacterium]
MTRADSTLRKAETALTADSGARSENRPDLLRAGPSRLTRVERWIIRFVRATFAPGLVDRWIRVLQRTIGSTWIHHCTKHLRHVYGLERLPPFDPEQSVILVANHRSFFDLYVVIAELVRRGLPLRIVFPVRSTFFYTRFLGLFVNGVMSFFAMYPPIFRERHQLALNVTSLGELSWLIRHRGVLAGMHPEGQRNKDGDPYTLLPAQRGVGKVIHETRVPVVPVFVNGLINDLPRQIRSNFDRSGREIIVVFGKPVDFGGLLDERGSPRVYQAIADRTLEAVGELGVEERAIRERRSA